MTAWDFIASAFKWLVDAPGFSDLILRILLFFILICLVIEILPGKAKPLSRAARAIGRAFNAETNDRIGKIEKRLDKNEKDNVRLQLLVLFSDYSQNTQEIMEVAHHYFVDLGGDWYLTSLFDEWLIKTKHGKPEWFDRKR